MYHKNAGCAALQHRDLYAEFQCHNGGNKKYTKYLRHIDDYIENVLYYARSENAENLDIKVMTDSKWLEYILGQLMSNSMKYFSSEREPEIRVYAEDMQDKTMLHFCDNGIGISESDLPYVFEKSFTGENGHTHAKSTGMGLYIVKKLCNKLGHAVSVKSVQGEFTEIILSFGKNNLNKMQ
jgi:signal transduction histidine kinase